MIETDNQKVFILVGTKVFRKHETSPLTGS